MSRPYSPRFTIPVLLASMALGMGMAACREATPTPEPTAAPEPTSAASPTVVARLEPTPTPTVDPAEQPFYPDEREEVPGVPVPLAARIIKVDPATEDADRRVQLAMADFDEELIYDWYLEHMPSFGWGEFEDRDGSLIFLHEEELSQRFADDGLYRTATVLFFAIEEEADWTLIIEAAEGDEPAPSEDEGDGDDGESAAEDEQGEENQGAEDDGGESAEEGEGDDESGEEG